MAGIRVEVRNLGQADKALRRTLRRVGGEGTRLDLFTNIGLGLVRWVDVNFRTSGSLVGGWAPLRPLTIFGRRKSSAVPLSNTGMLRSSFTFKATENSVVVGTANKIAEYHQFGTAPYVIVPRVKQALAFPAPPGSGGGGTYLRRRPYGTRRTGIATAKVARAAGFALPPGKGDIQSFAVVKKVNHPGLPARPMLPRTVDDVRDVLREVSRDFFQRVLGRPLA